jgi:hypothetical protein
MPEQEMSSTRKVHTVAIVSVIAIIGTIVRVLYGGEIPGRTAGIAVFAGQVIVTLTALVWWQLVAYGVYLSRSNPSYK